MTRTPRQGEIWALVGYPLPVLVVSGEMYNSLESVPTVLAMPVVESEMQLGGWTAVLGHGAHAIVDRVAPYHKNDFKQGRWQVSPYVLAETFRLFTTLCPMN